jgi:hypothetical protein
MRTRLAPKWPEIEGGLPRPLSISMPSDCVDNPCDTDCHILNEDPGPGGVTIPPVGPTFPWSVGDINNLPPAIAGIGTHEPCTTAEDCQFDQYCDNPTGVACSHHPCATGTANSSTLPNIGLNDSCSPCVQKICAADPTCCLDQWDAGNCAHDYCAAGSALDPACDPCVATICATRPGCCQFTCTSNADCSWIGAGSTCNLGTGKCTCAPGCPAGATCNAGYCDFFWSSANCVAQVGVVCAGKNCATEKWTAACVNMVDSVCGAQCEPPPGTCAHHYCYTGDRLANNCDDAVDDCVEKVCAARANCCSFVGRWDQACVDLVPLVCTVAGNPSQPLLCAPKGRCNSWLPGDSDSSCASADLTVGVPCNGTVPVCNRGTVAVPAGTVIELEGYNAGSGNFPSSEPSEVLGTCAPVAGVTTCTSTLAAALDPGQCISIDVDSAGACAPSALVSGMELRVNPQASVAECHCENNWTIYQDIPCGSPGCIATASVSYVKTVTLFVAVDASTSQRCSGVGADCATCPNDTIADRWNPMRNALVGFFQDASSAGLGIALRFWPDDSPAPCDSSPCPGPGGGGCAQPLVPLGTLTADPAPTDTQEQQLVAQLNAKVACGNTPTYPALDGALTWAINHKQANPEEEVAVVLITDGIPYPAGGCNQDNNQIALLAENAFYGYNVRTYPIGFGNANQALIMQIAQYGGGRGMFTTNIGAVLQSDIIAALRTIRGDVLPCDVEIPVDGVADPANEVDVIFTDGMGTDQTLTYISDPAFCGDGWYVDPLDPTVAKLCPTTCAMVQADPNARLRAILTDGCGTEFTPTLYSQTYEAQCPPGTKVQWGFLRWDSTTPSDSNVVFSVRAADTALGLASATFQPAGIARATPTDTQTCTMAGPAPDCPVDLYLALGELPDARRDFIEIQMALNPSADLISAPTVHNWEITYSCPDSE